MADVAIVTDSTACLPSELVEKYGIDIVPMEFIYQDRVYRDGVDMSPSDFYRLLATANKLPTTSAPSPTTYFEVLKKTAKKARSILIIAPSAKLTHAYDSAMAAAEMGREKLPATIEVLDSGTAAGAQGLVVLAAARAMTLGERLEKILNAAKAIMPVVHLVAFIDTLCYLAKGGRVPYIAAWASQLLEIKPIFELLPLSGGAIPLDKVRTRAKAIKRLKEIVLERADRKPMHAIVLHSAALQEAEKLKEHIASTSNCVEIYVRDFTPVMGVHTGPGLLGVAFYFDKAPADSSRSSGG
jgi:DegV family protein with EDD domain